MLGRRKFIASGAAAAFATTLPRFSVASTRVGDLEIQTISDGVMTLPGDAAYGSLPRAKLNAILSRFGQNTDEAKRPCNVTLMRSGTRVVLFDVGAGPDFLSGTGKLVDALETVGLAPEDVTDVVFTHAHPDHLWGLLDDFDDPLFYDANYFMGFAEYDYWTNPETVETIAPSRTTFAVGAARRLNRIADQIELFDDGEEILPGVTAMATFGHTPGHMAFRLGHSADAMLLIGDAVVNEHIAFERPDWPAPSDQNPDQGKATRRALLDMAAKDDLRIIGYHLPGAGIGRVGRAGDAFKYLGEDT